MYSITAPTQAGKLGSPDEGGFRRLLAYKAEKSTIPLSHDLATAHAALFLADRTV